LYFFSNLDKLKLNLLEAWYHKSYPNLDDY
jgi:hypothetical protein